MHVHDPHRRPIVAVVGGGGYIGSQCCTSVAQHAEVRIVRAPRLQASSRTFDGLRAEAEAVARPEMVAELAGVDVVVNAAGLARPTSSATGSLLGANAMLPWVLIRAAEAAGVTRVVHISTSAVQGRRVLDDSDRVDPLTPYAVSKALGERMASQGSDIEVIRYRPTSVQAAHRETTQHIIRFASSPLACVAAPGDDPTPQIPLSSVGDAVSLLCDLSVSPPSVVTHPWAGQTTSGFLRAIGGREPHEVPRGLAISLAGAVVRAHRLAAHGRRLELLVLGQRQSAGWLDSRIPSVKADWVSSCRQPPG